MKKLIFILSFIMGVVSIVAQPPQKMSYQAVVRDAQNSLVANQTVGVRISIISHGSQLPVYAETHTTTTNANGLMSLEVGTGTVEFGTFSTIDWANDDFSIRNQIDLAGGNNYTITGNQQLLSVPYAFYAGNASIDGNLPPDGTQTGDILYWNNNDSSWHIVPVGTPGQVLTLGPNGIPQWYSTALNQNVPPTITTDSLFNISGTKLNVGATITNSGSSPVIASGVCWSQTNPNPGIGNSHTSDGGIIGNFVSLVTGLTPGITWYIRAYATNNAGTGYGEVLTITSPTHCGTVSDNDGNVYNTVYIGNQCWMKENLRTTSYSNSTAITKGTLGTIITSSSKYYFEYNDDPANDTLYGLYYTWPAVMNGAGASNNNPSGIQGICPTGWHVPSHPEWCELENYLEPGIDGSCTTSGYRGSMAKKLAGTQYWTLDNTNFLSPGYYQVDSTGFNSSGFSALPTGYYRSYTSPSPSVFYYENLNVTGYWWTCSVYNNDTSYPRYRSLTYNSSGVNSDFRSYSYSHNNFYAYSVRCIKNE